MFRRILASFGLAAPVKLSAKESDGPPYAPYATEDSNFIYNLLFCDDPASFAANAEPDCAWQAVLTSHPADIAELEAIAVDDQEEADGRIRYLAYQRLRGEGRTVPPKRLLGVIYEVGLAEGLDTLAAFAEGGVRYINHSGKMVVIEGTPSFIPYVQQLFAASEQVVAAIGPWDKPRKAPPAKDTVRITFLVSDGLYFGEGPLTAMAKSAMGGPVIAHATKLLLAVVDAALK